MKQKIILFILVLKISFIRGYTHEKCCKPNQQLIEKNSTFICGTVLNKRLQTNFKNTDFFGKNKSGSCIDVYTKNETGIFAVDSSRKKLSKTKNVEVKFFPKCCHLGHEYNKTTHSCVKKENSDDLKNFLFDDSFIYIGLPKCRIIFDIILDSKKSVERNEDNIFLLDMKRRIPNGKYCVDSTLDGKFVVRTCEENEDICSVTRCIHKCCPDGQSYVNGSNCMDTFRYGVDLHSCSRIENPDAPFAIIHGIVKPIHRLNEAEYIFSVDEKGTFSTYMGQSQSYQYYGVSDSMYCMEHAYKKNDSGYIKFDNYMVFSKQIQQELELKIAVSRWAKIISCAFLLLTLLVYLVLPKMRNLFGKILLNYIIATFLFFFFLSYVQFNELSDRACTVMGYFSVLASVASFTWLNIMCINIWSSFGTPRTLSGPLQRNECKRLVQYSLYGWGFPIVWILFIYLSAATGMLPSSIHPYVGIHKCYIENSDTKEGNYAYLFFVTFPLLIQQIANSIFFIKTITYCLKCKAEIKKMNDASKQGDFNASKERLGLIMKLAVIMGVSFLFETISSLYNFQQMKFTMYIEVVWDTINCLQGLFIFIIFICKRKIYESIREKIPILKNRITYFVSSTSTTQVSNSKNNTGNSEVREMNIMSK